MYTYLPACTEGVNFSYYVNWRAAESTSTFYKHLFIYFSEKVSSEVYNTLIEYHLHLYKTASEETGAKKVIEKKIMDILQSDTANYDSDQVKTTAD